MTKTQAPVPQPLSGAGDAWTGWLVFASIILGVVGIINIIQGVAALADDSYFAVRSGNDLLITGFTTWGWIMIVWGAAQVAAGLGLNSGRGWARVLAIIIASISIVIQTAFLAAFPIWSVMIIALDVIVIFALTARWAEARGGL